MENQRLLQPQICIILPIYKMHIKDIPDAIKFSGAHIIAIETLSDISGVATPLDSELLTHIQIQQSEFNHGKTRNLGAQLAADLGADILVFLTQDALPTDTNWLSHLVSPIRVGVADATFARQLPRSDASLLESFARLYNYPSVSQSKTAADIENMGVKAYFFSNVCSAIAVRSFKAVGGFPEHVIMNEDMYLAAKLLAAGCTITYVAEAQVIHSHAYTLAEQFRRNFDVGVFFADAEDTLHGARVGGEGLKFVNEQLKFVAHHRRPHLWPVIILESAVKYIAFQLGRRHRLLPPSLRRRMSMHRYHWHQERSK